MNRYAGNRGIVERIPETSARGEIHSAPSYNAARGEEESVPPRAASRGGGLLGSLPFANLFSDKKPPEQSLFGGLGGIGNLLSKFTKESLEMEDYLLLGMLYLLYRESKDIEFLLIAGAMLIL